MITESEQDESPSTLDTTPDADPSVGTAPADSPPDDANSDAVESPSDGGDGADGVPASASPDGLANPPAPTPLPEPTPLRVRYFGRDGDDPEFALDGAVRHADGRIEIPAGKTAERTLQLLGRGREWERVGQPTIQHLQREVELSRTQFNESETRGNALWQFFQGLKAQPGEIQQAWWQDFQQNAPLLEAAVEREIARQQYDAARQMREPTPDQQSAVQQAQVEQAQGVFWNILQSARANHPTLTDDQLVQMAEEMWEERQAFLVTASYDDPARGVVRGQQAWNTAQIAKRLAREATYRTGTNGTTSPSPKVAQNAKVVGSASAPSPRLPQATPPAPARTAPVAGQPRNADGTFTDKDAYRREMERKYRL
jgi:hypothetical protein